jgi:hypothetical protein
VVPSEPRAKSWFANGCASLRRPYRHFARRGRAPPTLPPRLFDSLPIGVMVAIRTVGVVASRPSACHTAGHQLPRISPRGGTRTPQSLRRKSARVRFVDRREGPWSRCGIVYANSDRSTPFRASVSDSAHEVRRVETVRGSHLMDARIKRVYEDQCGDPLFVGHCWTGLSLASASPRSR